MKPAVLVTLQNFPGIHKSVGLQSFGLKTFSEVKMSFTDYFT